MRIKGLLPTANPVLASPAKKFRWTGKVVDLVELLYALDTCDCINNGEIGVEELADAFSDIFGVESRRLSLLQKAFHRQGNEDGIPCCEPPAS